MPELPEIETLRRNLAPLLPWQVRQLYLSRVAPVETTRPSNVRRVLIGARLEAVARWGKYLLLDTAKADTLVLHLGMSGKLLFYEAPVPPRPKHTHLELYFRDGSLLRFIDARRFGTISLSNKQRTANPFLARLGPDYLDPALDAQTYIARCRRHPHLTLKTMLLHQGIAAGLGNIYACEALYRAGLDPRRRIEATRDAELSRLLTAVRESLRLGIRHGGTSFRDYLNGLGQRGEMKRFLQVYDRAGQQTLDGRGRVIRIVQQQRATFFCPALQK